MRNEEILRILDGMVDERGLPRDKSLNLRFSHRMAILEARKRLDELTAREEARKHVAHIYAREWGAPERIGPRQWRWPQREDPKS